MTDQTKTETVTCTHCGREYDVTEMAAVELVAIRAQDPCPSDACPAWELVTPADVLLFMLGTADGMMATRGIQPTAEDVVRWATIMRRTVYTMARHPDLSLWVNLP